MTTQEQDWREGTTNLDQHYEFRIGRIMSKGAKNPGILVIDHCRTFKANKSYSDGKAFTYVCIQSRTPGIMCKATATVNMIESDDGKKVHPKISRYDLDHQCEVNLPKTFAEEARHKMREAVRKHPELPFQKAIHSVRIQYGKRLGSDPSLRRLFVGELGSDSALKQMLTRIRTDKTGKQPRARDAWNPDGFLQSMHGPDHGLTIFDSNDKEDLPVNWRGKFNCEIENCLQEFSRQKDVKRHVNTVKHPTRQMLKAAKDL